MVGGDVLVFGGIYIVVDDVGGCCFDKRGKVMVRCW